MFVLVERYVSELHKHDQASGEGVFAVPTGAHIKDSEQVLAGISELFQVLV